MVFRYDAILCQNVHYDLGGYTEILCKFMYSVFYYCTQVRGHLHNLYVCFFWLFMQTSAGNISRERGTGFPKRRGKPFLTNCRYRAAFKSDSSTECFFGVGQRGNWNIATILKPPDGVLSGIFSKQNHTGTICMGSASKTASFPTGKPPGFFGKSQERQVFIQPYVPPIVWLMRHKFHREWHMANARSSACDLRMRARHSAEGQR